MILHNYQAGICIIYKTLQKETAMYADRIKQLRNKLDISVAKFSKKIGVPERTITSYERGEHTPSLDFLAKLCINLNINAHWFLLGQGEMFNGQSSPYKDTKELIHNEVRKILKDEGVIK